MNCLKPYLVLCLLFFGVDSFSQNSFAKIDFSYLVTKNPVFKVGYERSAEGSYFNYSGGIEYGRYASNTTHVKFSSIQDYALTGFGISSEVKYFLLPEAETTNYGGFLSAFALGRSLKETRIENMSANSEGYNLSNSSIHTQSGIAFNYGLAIGYRSGCYAGPLHLEAIAGYGFGVMKLQDDPTGFRSRATNFISSGDYLRLELNLIIDL